MSSERTSRTLAKIISHISRTLEYCERRSFEEFQGNSMLQEACVFNILQIGELSKTGLDAAFIDAHPEIPWKQMYGLRNRIVHGYADVQMRIVWDTITEDFPDLRKQLQALLGAI